MTNFKYKVKDKTGKAQGGSLDAEDRRSAVARLQEMGFYVLEVREAPHVGASINPLSLFARFVFNPIFGGVSIGPLAMFYRQFATMLRSGMSVSQAMSSLRVQGGSRVLRKAAGETLDYVSNGGKLSEAFARYPWVFPELHISLIQAAEASGNLESMVNKIADYLERENSIRTRLRIATLYPKILVLAVIFIPKFPILIMEGFDAYRRETMRILFPILAAVAGIWVGYRLLVQIPPIKYFSDAVKVAVPKLGKTVRMLALCKFYRVLAAMYAAGTPLSRGLTHAASATGNWYMTTRLKSAASVVDRGQPLTDALRRTGVLPGMALDMIATGEQTGNVDEMLDKAAEYTESEAEVAVFQSTVILGVVLIIAIASYIGWFVVQFYLGQYNNVLNYKG